MPVNSVHPSYREYSGDWANCRDAYDGQKAIKAKGTVYLPALGGMTTTEYNAYKERALFYSITAKTVGAMVGMALSRAPVLKYPEEMEKYFKDVEGIQFIEAYNAVLRELLLIGRIGVLIDRPVSGGDILLSYYKTEHIINWRLNKFS